MSCVLDKKPGGNRNLLHWCLKMSVLNWLQKSWCQRVGKTENYARKRAPGLQICCHSRVTQGCCFLLLTLKLCMELKTWCQEHHKFGEILSQEAERHMFFPWLALFGFGFFLLNQGLKEMLLVISWTSGNFHPSINRHLFNKSSMR